MSDPLAGLGKMPNHEPREACVVTCAVTGQRIGPHRAAVAQISQDFQTLADGLVAFAVLDIDDETDTAGIVLVARVVEPFGGG